MEKIKHLFAIIVLIAIDQITKVLAVTHLKGKEAYSLIDGVFELRYLENRGAAFGVLEDQRILFLVVTLILLAGMIYVYLKLPANKKYVPIKIIFIFLTAGAIGNMIDRIANNYVIDFLYFSLIDFPIFNVADCYVTVCAIAFIILFAFYYNEEDFAFIKRKKDDSNED